MYIVGFSMGAIQAIRWVGEHKGQTKVKGLVSISCPIDLSKASPYLSQRKNWVYAKWMTKALITLAKTHEDLLKEKGIDLDYSSSNFTQSILSLQTHLLSLIADSASKCWDIRPCRSSMKSAAAIMNLKT